MTNGHYYGRNKSTSKFLYTSAHYRQSSVRVWKDWTRTVGIVFLCEWINMSVIVTASSTNLGNKKVYLIKQTFTSVFSNRSVHLLIFPSSVTLIRSLGVRMFKKSFNATDLLSLICFSTITAKVFLCFISHS